MVISAKIKPPINPIIINTGEGFPQVYDAVAIRRRSDIAVLLIVPSIVITPEASSPADENIFEFNAGFPDLIFKCEFKLIS